MTIAKVTKYKDSSARNVFRVGDLVQKINTGAIVLVTHPTNKKGKFGGVVITVENNSNALIGALGGYSPLDYQLFYGSVTLKSTRDEQSKY
jgi:hypothetical protein|nr:MAG TPA: hypothetical protein [Crassvirales sp.]